MVESDMKTRYPAGAIRAQDWATRYRKTSEFIGSSSLAKRLRSAHIAAMHTDTDTTSTGAQRRFKYTRELIKIAREDMTQDEIAKVCRVTQSVVSGWANGASRAKEHQVAELLRRYGHRLNRVTSKVYLALREAPTGADWEPMRTVTWEEEVREEVWDSVPGEALAAPRGANRRKRSQASDDPSAPTDRGPAVDLPEPRWVTRVVERSRIEPDTDALKIVQVEGPITLRHTMHLLVEGERARLKVVEREACYRWLVHHQGRDRFVLARQQRRQLLGQERQFHRQIASSPDFLWVSASDDSACWLTHLQGPMSAEELLALTDAQTSEPIAFPNHKTVVGAGLLPFLVRKMLVELGYAVPGVERISASG